MKNNHNVFYILSATIVDKEKEEIKIDSSIQPYLNNCQQQGYHLHCYLERPFVWCFPTPPPPLLPSVDKPLF